MFGLRCNGTPRSLYKGNEPGTGNVGDSDETGWYRNTLMKRVALVTPLSVARRSQMRSKMLLNFLLSSLTMMSVCVRVSVFLVCVSRACLIERMHST